MIFRFNGGSAGLVGTLAVSIQSVQQRLSFLTFVLATGALVTGLPVRLAAQPTAGAAAGQPVVEQIVVSLDEQIVTWAPFAAYGRLWARLPSALAPVPPSSPQQLAQLMADRLVVLLEAEATNTDEIGPEAIEAQLQAVPSALGDNVLEEVRLATGLSPAEIREMAREEAIIEKILNQRFRYLAPTEVDDAETAEIPGEDARETYRRAITEWLRLQRRNRKLIIALPPEQP